MTVAQIIDYVYGSLIEQAEVPSLDQIANAVGSDRVSTARLIREAKIGKTLLLDENDALWMAGPFSARPTPYVVRHGGKQWWANCAWDAFGVGAMVNAPVDVSATCIDCGEQLEFRVVPADARTPDYIVHFVVPARRWYDDLGFT